MIDVRPSGQLICTSYLGEINNARCIIGALTSGHGVYSYLLMHAMRIVYLAPRSTLQNILTGLFKLIHMPYTQLAQKLPCCERERALR